MEVRADGAGRDAHPLADLFVSPPFQIVEEHHFAPILGEDRKSGEKAVGKIGSLRRIGWRLCSADSGALEQRLGSAQPRMAQVIPGDAANNLSQPGSEAGRVAAVVDVVHCIYKSLLAHVLCSCDVAHNGQRHCARTPQVPLSEYASRGPVRLSNLRHELRVCLAGIAHRTRHPRPGKC
jgi:hypothetical protein